jgi:transcriptional regulator with XRE-family HTH domain
MATFGARLRIERARLGLTQAALAEIGGVKPNAQIAYEKEDNAPTAKYLQNLARNGVDINFLFYGEYANIGPTKQVTELLSVITQLPPAQQAMGYVILNLLKRTVAAEAGVAKADVLWRAARVFEQFVAHDEAGRSLIETAAKFDTNELNDD